MDINKNCKSCDMTKCNEYCAVQAGKALCRFLMDIDVIDTTIGNIKEKKKNDTDWLIVSGVQLDGSLRKAELLSPISINMIKKDKFKEFLGKPPIQIANEYIEKLGNVSKIYKRNILDKIKNINENKVLIVPLKPGCECSVTEKDKTKHITSRAYRISSIIWSTDKTTGELNSKIIIKAENDFGIETYKIPIEKYGIDIKNTSIENSVCSDNFDRSLIEMTTYGFIKPIEIVGKRIRLAIDNTNVYLIDDSGIKIIGCWDSIGQINYKINIAELQKTDSFKLLKNNIQYIQMHRRFIAPYGIAECKVVNA